MLRKYNLHIILASFTDLLSAYFRKSLNFALLYFEVDVFEGPYVIAAAFGGAVVYFADFEVGVFFSAGEVPPAFEVPEKMGQAVGEGAGADLAEAVLFALVFYFYCGGHVNESPLILFFCPRIYICPRIYFFVHELHEP
jgi:hypothetical protein